MKTQQANPKRKRQTLLILKMTGLFVVVLLVMEFTLGMLFVDKISETIEDSRRKEFIESWKQYLIQRKKVHEGKVTGYAWWGELGDAVGASNISSIVDNVGSDASLVKEYDIYEVVDKNSRLLFATRDGQVQPQKEQEAGAGTEGDMRKRFLELADKKYREYYPRYLKELKKQKKTGIDKMVVWHFVTRYRGEIRLITLSPVCDNIGYPYVRGYYLFGYKISKVLNKAEQIIPARITVTSRRPEQAYAVIEQKGQRTGERYYFAMEPNIRIRDIARGAFYIFIVIQVILSVLVFMVISPYFTWRFTAQLQEVIDKRTGQLREANAELRSKNKKLHNNMEMAKMVQESIIKTIPITPELNIDARYLAMDEVGGDFYDVRRIGRDTYSFMIADVSGHGVSAALITTMAKACFVNHGHFSRTPAKVCGDVNRDVYTVVSGMGYFLTAFYSIFNMKTNELAYTDCGHQKPILYRDGTKEIEELSTEQGLPIGISSSPGFDYKITTFNVNDMLFLYTDGITEARNETGEFYSTGRLMDFVRKNGGRNPGEFLRELMDEIDAFCGERKPDDDRAALLIKPIKTTTSNGRERKELLVEKI
ncbi:MAG: serine/threonine-protein phosphatase [bacterium]|nr:serine/threonine-protein phosphatase [bacterium]